MGTNYSRHRLRAGGRAMSDTDTLGARVEAALLRLARELVNDFDTLRYGRAAQLQHEAATLRAEVARLTAERDEAQTNKHPWYGPCDAIRRDGSCTECARLIEWKESGDDMVLRLRRERDEARAEVERLTKERDGVLPSCGVRTVPQHVCGLRGFQRGLDGLNDRCPACDARAAVAG